MFERIADSETGVAVDFLTSGPGSASVTYQTHPMWTPKMGYLVFQAGNGSTRLQPYALDMATGDSAPLSHGPADDWSLARQHDRFYYRLKDQVYVRRVSECFGPGETPQLVGSLPELHQFESSSMSLDANEETFYVAACLKKGREWGIGAIDLTSFTWELICHLPFQVGHVQANPEVTRLVMFCHETGGDAPQRIWVVNVTDGAPRPFYQETHDEWVTHEVWWGKDRALFTIWPYDEAHRRLPHGVVSAELTTGRSTVHSQFPAWHTHGSPDGQWAVADDMCGNLWLIRIGSGERRLLTRGHIVEGFKNHPHPSFTPDSKAVVFTSSLPGRECVALAGIPRWESLPKADETGSLGGP